MIVPSNKYGLSFRGFSDQEASSLNKRLQPADPIEFLKWISQTLRDHRITLENLSGKHRSLITKQSNATRALKNLDKLVSIEDRATLDHMKDMHRGVVHKTKGIGAVIARCKSVIDETTASYQFVGETLKSVLADRHKKIAMQKELGLRLKDIDAEFNRCNGVIASLASGQDRLSSAVQKLLNKLRVKLPPTMRDKISKRERVEAIADSYGKKITEENTPLSERKTEREPERAPERKEEIDSPLEGITDFSDVEVKKTNYTPLLAIAGGVILGHILITKVL